MLGIASLPFFHSGNCLDTVSNSLQDWESYPQSDHPPLAMMQLLWQSWHCIQCFRVWSGASPQDILVAYGSPWTYTTYVAGISQKREKWWDGFENGIGSKCTLCDRDLSLSLSWHILPPFFKGTIVSRSCWHVHTTSACLWHLLRIMHGAGTCITASQSPDKIG